MTKFQSWTMDYYRTLFEERKELEMNISNSTQAAKRMSQNVEQLQWRIKNNFVSNVQHVFDRKDEITECLLR